MHFVVEALIIIEALAGCLDRSLLWSASVLRCDVIDHVREPTKTILTCDNVVSLTKEEMQAGCLKSTINSKPSL